MKLCLLDFFSMPGSVIAVSMNMTCVKVNNNALTTIIPVGRPKLQLLMDKLHGNTKSVSINTMKMLITI